MIITKPSPSPLASLLGFSPRLSLAFILATSLCISFFIPTIGWTEEQPSSIDERILRMERDIRILHRKNQELEDELRALREAVDAEDAATPELRKEGPKELENRPGKDEQGKTQSAQRREESPYRGFWLSSQDGRHDLQVGGRITARFTGLQPDHPLSKAFSVERARLFFNGFLFGHYDLRVQVEFAEDPKLKDGYMDIHPVPWARLRVGQFKVPFTLEYQQSHKYIDFAERSIAVDGMRFVGRDIGAMLWGSLGAGMAQYQLAVLNGTGENTSDDNDDKDLAGRLVLRPLGGEPKGAFSGTHLGVSGTVGNQDTDFSSTQFLTVAGTEYVEFAPGTALRGRRSRLGTEFALPMGPALLKAEWMWMWMNDFRKPPLSEDLEFSSWYVSGAYLLTGETKTLGRVTPARPFSPSQERWGAWEVAARYSRFNSDADLFRLGMASGTSQVDAFAVGLNWYMNELMRLTLNYEYADFEDDLTIDGATLSDEHAVLLQCQLEF